jgi:uncharacterized membrane protein
MFPLAYAEQTDTSSSGMVLLLICAGLILVACALAVVPLVLANRRGRRDPQSVLTAVIVWGVAVAGVSIYVTLNQMQWSKQYTTDLETGYLDPQNVTGAPHQPWALWAGLAIAYVAMIIWASWRKGRADEA